MSGMPKCPDFWISTLPLTDMTTFFIIVICLIQQVVMREQVRTYMRI